MHINTPREGDIRYNSIEGCFEARVTVRDGTGIYVYAAEAPAPLQAEMPMIARRLTETARRLHLGASKGLHLRRAPAPATRLAA